MEKLYCKNCKWSFHFYGNYACEYYNHEINLKFRKYVNNHIGNKEYTVDRKGVIKDLAKNGIDHNDFYDGKTCESKKEYWKWRSIETMHDCPLNKDFKCPYFEQMGIGKRISNRLDRIFEVGDTGFGI